MRAGQKSGSRYIYPLSLTGPNRVGLETKVFDLLSFPFLSHHRTCRSAYGGLICFQRVSNRVVVKTTD